jgi:hypothetical protein
MAGGEKTFDPPKASAYKGAWNLQASIFLVRCNASGTTPISLILPRRSAASATGAQINFSGLKQA